ncbi:hypothetical protein LEP1GSC103_0628 [Leptospira borgpetersenii serovar Javanica str. UI 09931]|uniref:Uncharacterized protein n=1 Tax=Leptospira borgpetersenii serovar Javanica str. UI 09931 TaxID=1049767 RepID=A0AAV3J8Z6_LEPBO|nr:hypothetical protein LEP1GSC101_0475 [Leptospira borgpetersenii str. UI 09149]EMN59738.1 hypothetical protein LEP1GSC090_2754 [Leptospira borgpetersenii serovar Javanica str. MK146]EPG56109.1 hypothetical protein LEP1GSC103_0628 [Leptospira borgpetersenii serovar Javanica str. UI 09931]
MRIRRALENSKILFGGFIDGYSIWFFGDPNRFEMYGSFFFAWVASLHPD